VPSLRDTQRAFGNALLGGNAASMAALVREDGFSVAERVGIYVNNSRIGFEQALAATYPVIQRLGGAAWFTQQARDYQLRFPSRCGDLQYVGQHFPAYLQAGLAGSDHEYFVDVAWLEWAYQETLVAARGETLDPATLANVPEKDYASIAFIAHPTLRLVASAFPVLAIWQANQGESDAHAAETSLADGADRLVLVRRATHVELRRLPDADYALLEQFTLGTTLGEAAKAVAARHPDFDLPASLRLLVSLNLFSAIEVRDAGPAAGGVHP
jgi:hypothetical protein